MEERLTVAQALIKFLDNQYMEVDNIEYKFVEGIFAIFGHGNLLGIGEALSNEKHNLKVIQGRNEQGMAHAAIGFSKQRLRRQIYACTASIGPGSANILTAAATATVNRIPLLLLLGDNFASRQPDPVLQQIEQNYDLNISTNDAFKPVSKYWDRINRPEQLMSSLINLMLIITDPSNTGTCVLALPQDVQGESYLWPNTFFKKRVYKLERNFLTPSILNEAVNLILKKKKPLIICGGGVRYAGAFAELDEFSTHFNIPFGETNSGKSALPSAHSKNLGGIGVLGTLSSNKLAKEADLIIGIGTRYTDFTTCSKWLFQNPNVEFLNINISPFDSNKMNAISLVGDAKTILSLLITELKKLNYISSYKNEIDINKIEWDKELIRLSNLSYSENFKREINDNNNSINEFLSVFKSVLTQTKVISIVNKTIPKDSVIVSSAGSLPGDLQRIWKSLERETYHLEYGYSCMGYEINGALGVKLAIGNSREVFSFVGDGSYLMLHSELITSIQERAKIIVLLFDNMSWGCINNLEMGFGMDNFLTEFRFKENNDKFGPFIKVDFAKNAASYGLKTYTVFNEEDLQLALIDSLKQNISCLLDIKVLPKTMSKSYESFWRVGSSEASKNLNVLKATDDLKKQLKFVKKY